MEAVAVVFESACPPTSIKIVTRFPVLKLLATYFDIFWRGIQVRGLVKQHISSFDHFINVDMQSIMRANSVVRSEVRVIGLVTYLYLDYWKLYVYVCVFFFTPC